MLSASLRSRLLEVAAAPRLLVASDYDGTLAEIVQDRDRATPHVAAARALVELASLPATRAAVISGRGRADVMRVSGFGDPVEVIGSHGAEFAHGLVPGLTAGQQQLVGDLTRELDDLCRRHPAVNCEIKPASLAIHYRGAPRDAADRALDELMAGPARWPGVQVRPGLEVIELSVVTATKGDAIRYLIGELAPDATIFIGDDVTDEDAFAALGPDDLTIKVGGGTTRASHRVEAPSAVGEVLATLAVARRGVKVLSTIAASSGRLDPGPVV